MINKSSDLLLGFSAERVNRPQWGMLSSVASETYPGAIPTDDLLSFMDYPLAEGTISVNVKDHDGTITTFSDPTRKGIVREDTGETFGVFKQGYKIHQPKEWLVDNLSLILDGGLQVGQARLLRGGAVAMVQVELPETRMVGDVAFRPYLTAVTSHDGSLATSYFTGNIVLVCENQMGIARSESNTSGALLKIRHSSQSLGRVMDARHQLDLVVESAGDDFEREVKALMETTVSDALWRDFTHALTGIDGKEGRSRSIAERQIGVLNEMWIADERVNPWRNTAWGVVSAVNTAVHHKFNVRGDREERNAMRTVEGGWDALDNKTLRILEEVR